MLIFLLLFVEENIFEPVLPPPEVEPELEWFKEIEKNWISVGLNRETDYNLVSFRFRELTLESISERNFTDDYHIEASLKSLSYNIEASYIEWDTIRFSKASGWKWLSEDQSYLIGWFETYVNRDSIAADLGARFYQAFNPFFIGGWTNYRESVDYGLIMQLYFLRGEFGKERRCLGFVSEYGEIKFGRFRERFPMIFYPLENFFPKVKVFYGTKINFFGFNIMGGKKYFYAEGSDTLSWKEGKVYFANFEYEKENFGFQYFYQNEGSLREYGELYMNLGWGIIGSRLYLNGYLTPRKFVTGGLSL
ncbi:MAG: hypothetical protein P8Z50_00035, partial [candidate division WOR-3 bacterium]